MDEPNRRFVTAQLRKTVVSLLDQVEHAEGYTNRIQEGGKSAHSQVDETAALLTALELSYEGPGYHRPGGPRHDNDHEDIGDISIVPTHGELCCTDDPYLPANVPGGPHRLPGDSMARLFDIQFRLLREELTYVSRHLPIEGTDSRFMQRSPSQFHSTCHGCSSAPVKEA